MNSIEREHVPRTGLLQVLVHVAAAAGHVDHEALTELAQRTLQPAASNGGGMAEAGSNGANARLAFYPKETEQYHICFGGPGIARGHGHPQRRRTQPGRADDRQPHGSLEPLHVVPSLPCPAASAASQSFGAAPTTDGRNRSTNSS